MSKMVLKNKLLFILILWGFSRKSCKAVEPAYSPSFIFYYENGSIEVPMNCSGLEEVSKHPKYDLSKCTVLYVHGFGTNQLSKTVLLMIEAYLLHGGYNFMTLNWVKEAAAPNYLNAFNNVAKLGKAIATILLEAFRCSILFLDKIELIGHSLGAQMCGCIGRNVIQQSKGEIILQFICGLDPAGPLYTASTTLCKTDGVFVLIIHTDWGCFGIPLCTGTVDFKPNGGCSVQPGCSALPDPGSGSCSHSMCVYIWADCINNDDSFWGVLIEDPNGWQTFKENKTVGGNCIPLGPLCPRTAQGNYYLQTNGAKLYGKGMAGTVYSKP